MPRKPALGGPRDHGFIRLIRIPDIVVELGRHTRIDNPPPRRARIRRSHREMASLGAHIDEQEEVTVPDRTTIDPPLKRTRILGRERLPMSGEKEHADILTGV